MKFNCKVLKSELIDPVCVHSVIGSSGGPSEKGARQCSLNISKKINEEGIPFSLSYDGSLFTTYVSLENKEKALLAIKK